MISRVLAGTQPLLPSDNLISSHSPTRSVTSTFVPSCRIKRSLPLSSGELLPLTCGEKIIADSLW